MRHLHALFREPGMVVGDHVVSRRPVRIYRDLVDPAVAHPPAYAPAVR
ncbi:MULTISPECIES: hypothetical protein [unclassified Streptomyces]